MVSLTDLPWVQVHNFLLASGSIREPKELCIEAVKKIRALVSYDQARVYFINDNEKVQDEFLIGADKRWSKLYREYFSTVANGQYNLTRLTRGQTNAPRAAHWNVHDWATERGEFITDYINPQGLRHSLGWGLLGADYRVKCVCALDRTRPCGYSEAELGIISVLHPHLDNLHQNLFVPPAPLGLFQGETGDIFSLTRRESEIAALLREGVTPANIGKKLSVSIATVYRHIANLHSKLRVSNRQELIVKLLRPPLGTESQ
jgi:DNA-binding CsgD family transcriptional regulator